MAFFGILELEDKCQLVVGSQGMVQVLSIEQFDSVSPELKLEIPTYKINYCNVTLSKAMNVTCLATLSYGGMAHPLQLDLLLPSE